MITHSTLVTENKWLRAENQALQAKIDNLMLEYCPEEMSTEQIEEWGRNQKPSKEFP